MVINLLGCVVAGYLGGLASLRMVDNVLFRLFS